MKGFIAFKEGRYWSGIHLNENERQGLRKNKEKTNSLKRDGL